MPHKFYFDTDIRLYRPGLILSCLKQKPPGDWQAYSINIHLLSTPQTCPSATLFLSQVTAGPAAIMSLNHFMSRAALAIIGWGPRMLPAIALLALTHVLSFFVSLATDLRTRRAYVQVYILTRPSYNSMN